MNNVQDMVGIGQNIEMEGVVLLHFHSYVFIMTSCVTILVFTRFANFVTFSSSFGFMVSKISWRALHEEMQLDMQRIWKRNLGRDDRCIADSGKEVSS